MASFNKVLLMGNLTREPDLRVTPKGIPVCKFGVAVNSTYKDKDGNTKEEVTFVDIDAFGKQAEIIAKHMDKGRSLFVEGRLKLDSWEDKQGGKRSKLKVILEGFQFVGGSPRMDGQEEPQRTESPRIEPHARSVEPEREIDPPDDPF